MQKLGLPEIKEIQLKIFKAFDKFCRKNDLRYTAAGGTLIGVIRHKGYIPWDDDIDVVMPRKDYMKFIELTEQGMNGYIVESPFKNHANNAFPYVYTYAKIFDTDTTLIESPYGKRIKSHVYIDVFPVDSLPENKEKIQAAYKHARRLIMCNSAITRAYYNRKDFSKNILYRLLWGALNIIGSIFPPNYFSLKLNKYCAQWNAFENSEYCGVIVAGYGEREAVRKEIFSSYFEMPFENLNVKVVSGYHEWLSSIYGDYMKLPPENQRVSNHDYEAYID